ncbi:MAG TPA: T9SS type A sorting domain-containing protein [Edaphocola sp.]|nr:T9SS type A sorting domain-containing protein [Edaphocola sp.]
MKLQLGILQEIEKGQPNCPPICKSANPVSNNLNSALCVNSTRTLYHNYDLPLGASVIWEWDSQFQKLSETNNSITVKGLTKSDKSYIKFTIQNPCGANIRDSFYLPVGTPNVSLKVNYVEPEKYEAKNTNFKPGINTYYWNWEGSGWNNINEEYYPTLLYAPIGGSNKEICLKVANNCGSDSSCKNVYLTPGPNTMSMKLSSDGLNVYPNPTTDNWMLELPEAMDSYLSMYNAMGTLVWSAPLKGRFITIPGIGLSTGIYLLRVAQEGAVYSVKMVKD